MCEGTFTGRGVGGRVEGGEEEEEGGGRWVRPRDAGILSSVDDD
jgi:hypothetical protein